MSQVLPRLVRGTTTLLLGRGMAAAAGLAALALMARHLEPAEFGAFGLAWTLIQLLSVPVDLGSLATATRESARNAELEPRLLGASLIQRSFLLLPAMAVFVVAVRLTESEPSRQATLALGALALPPLVLGAWMLPFQLRGRFGLPALAHIIQRTIFLTGITVTALWLELGLWEAMVSLVVSHVPGMALLALAGRRVVQADITGGIRELWPFLRQSAPLGLAALFAATCFYVDTVILAQLDGPEAVAQYQAAFRTMGYFSVLPGLVLPTVFPLLSSYHRQDRHRFNQLAHEVLALLLLIIAPLCCAGGVLAHGLLEWIYGPWFTSATETLRLLLASAVAITVGALTSGLLVAARRQHAWLWVTAVAAIFNIALNISLIPRFSHQGAALATLATEVLLVSITLAITIRHDGFRPLGRSTLASLVVTLAVGAAAWLAQPLPMPLGLGVAAMVHLAAGWLVWRCWLRQRWDQLRQDPAPDSMT